MGNASDQPVEGLQKTYVISGRGQGDEVYTDFGFCLGNQTGLMDEERFNVRINSWSGDTSLHYNNQTKYFKNKTMK